MKLPFFTELEAAANVLIAGAGGGFDVFTGLPLYFHLKNAGKKVHLASLSFTDLAQSNSPEIAPSLYEVTAKHSGPRRYFPERHLAHWFWTRKEETPIYCFGRTGTKPITEGYQCLHDRLQFDTVILVDGGTDSLMRGDEDGLGTPEEDMASLAAVDALEVPRKYLVCLGFGIDAFHGVCHAHFLEAVAAISKSGGYLGAWSLLQEMPEVRLYEEAVDHVYRFMLDHPSIVNASIISALEGHFGDYHATYRTEGTELFINPLMGLYWAFRVEEVASRNLYLERIRETTTYLEQHTAIHEFRESLKTIRKRVPLPM